MKRRNFLHSLSLGSGLLLPFGRHIWAATTAGNNESQKKLIVIMLRGAIDGLNVVAPFGDPNYANLRPTIALGRPGQENGALNLDGYFGLHPALTDLQSLWQEKNSRLSTPVVLLTARGHTLMRKIIWNLPPQVRKVHPMVG